MSGRESTVPVASRFGMSRIEAADYLSISPPTFDWLVAHQMMPEPRLIKSKPVWIRPEIEDAARNLPFRRQTGEASADTTADDEWN